METLCCMTTVDRRRSGPLNTVGVPDPYLILQDDGNVVIYDGANHPHWATNTVLPQPVRPSSAQLQWRWCHNCQGVFFAGHSTAGLCPNGGPHDGSQSGHYAMAFGDVQEGVQDQWRWCYRCEGLFYTGEAADRPCPAGGEHDGIQQRSTTRRSLATHPERKPAGGAALEMSGFRLRRQSRRWRLPGRRQARLYGEQTVQPGLGEGAVGIRSDGRLASVRQQLHE